MNLQWTEEGWADYLYWQKNDLKTLARINDLIKDIHRNHYKGIGKPEPLKHDKHGYWSRRIDSKNRIVYKVSNDAITITQCRTHYDDK